MSICTHSTFEFGVSIDFNVVSVVVLTGPSQGLKIRGGTYYWVGIICPTLVEIGLTDLPKSGGGG